MGTATHRAPVPWREVFEVSTHRHRGPVGSPSCRTRPASCPGRVGSPCSSLPVGVTGAASCRPTSVPWSAWSVFAGTARSHRSPPASVFPSAPPTLASRPWSSTCPAGRRASCGSCARPTRIASCSTGHSPCATGSPIPRATCYGSHPRCPASTHDLTAARTHRIIRICERQGVPVLADRAYIGVGHWATTPIRRLPNQDLTTSQQTITGALSAARAPVERSVARLKSWRIFRKARCSPNRMTTIAAALLTLERQR